MQSVLLDKKKHNRKSFDCAVEPLNNYLKLIANQHSLRDNSRTYVLVDPQSTNKIIGFYTLSMVSINISALPKDLQKKHQSNQTAGLIARLVVDKHYAKQGFGSWLLVDALKKLLQASDAVAFPMVIVDAKDSATSFYKSFGFLPFLDEKNKLFITVKDIRTSFS